MSRDLDLAIKLSLDGKDFKANLAMAEKDVKVFSRALADAAKAGDPLAAARKALGVIPHAEIKSDIDRVRAAYKLLADSGKLTGAELAQAHDRMKAKVAELGESMNGAKMKADRFFDLGRAGLYYVGLTQVVGAVKAVGGAIFEANAKAEALRNTLNFAAGGKEGGARELDYLRETARALGLDVESAGKAFGGLSAAARGTALAGQPVRDIFEVVAGASTVMGLSADQTQRALLALQQMMSKGTVSAEELRGQLGEQLPGAFAIAARTVGVTEAELGKMLETGQIAASDFLPKFAAELKKTFGADLQGTLGSARAELNRMGNAWDGVLRAIGESGGNAALVGTIKALREGLEAAAAAMPAVANGVALLAEGAAIAGVALLGEKLWVLTKAITAARVASLAFAATPIGLAMLAAAGAVALFHARMEQANEEMERGAKEAKTDKEVIDELKRAMDRLNGAEAPEGYAEALRVISQRYREGAMSAEQAKAAAAAYASGAEASAAKLAAAVGKFAAFAPPDTRKYQAALKELDDMAAAARAQGKLDEAAYQRARLKIIDDFNDAARKLYQADALAKLASLAPPSEAARQALEKLDAEYRAARAAGVADEKKYQADRARIIEDALRDNAAKAVEIRRGVAESERRAMLGDTEFAVEQIRRKYQAEFDAARDEADAGRLFADIERRMETEIADLRTKLAGERIAGNVAATQAALKNARTLVAGEEAAASQVADAWKSVNAVKSATGWDAVSFHSGDQIYAANLAGVALNQSPDTFAAGGRIAGPGTGTSDSILARVSNGEFVMRAAAVDRYGVGFMDAINRMALPRFAAGGSVGGGAAPAAGGIVIENLNLPGVGNAREFVAALRQMLRIDPNLLGAAAGGRAG